MVYRYSKIAPHQRHAGVDERARPRRQLDVTRVQRALWSTATGHGGALDGYSTHVIESSRMSNVSSRNSRRHRRN